MLSPDPLQLVPAAAGHAVPGSRAGVLMPTRELYRDALRIRLVEQRLLQLFGEGRLFGTVHTCIGQEWSAVAVARALGPGDLVFSNHRCHGHFLARTGDVHGLAAEIMGRQTGVCGGRGGSQHLCAPGFYSNGIQGGIVPVAAGLAYAQMLTGKGGIAAVFVGDGTLGEGVLYEALNVAAKWRLPLLIVLENNGYAQSTPRATTLAGDIGARAEAFGIPVRRADTWSPDALVEAAAAAAHEVREGSGPVFLQVDTYRLMAHSKGDDERDAEERRAYWEWDELDRCRRERPELWADLLAELEPEIAAAFARAEAAPFAAPDPTAAVGGGADEEVAWSTLSPGPGSRHVELIRDALARNLQRHPRMLLLGEDIVSPYGGAFKASRGLSDAFPDRVRNTPISEAAIVGVGNGLALGGYRPVCEIMFGDFLTLATDQLVNHAAKFRYMYNDQVRVPLVVRTPMGGRRGYGPTHSQSLEKHFLGVPGLRVLALNPRLDPGEIFDALLAEAGGPTLVIENKLAYGRRHDEPIPTGFALERSDERFPTLRLRPPVDPEVTLVCYGGMLPEAERAAEQAFEQDEIVCEVVCPSCLYPLNLTPIAASVRRTSRLVVAEEGQGFAAFGSEVVARLAERGDAPLRVRRVAPPAHAIPSAGPLEAALLPGAEHIAAAVAEVR